MNKDKLLERKNDIENRFSNASKAKSEAEIEQYRLQGEHRLIESLLVEIEADNTKERKKK